MAYVPNSGSVLAFQGTVPWSVLGTVNIGTQPGSVVAYQSDAANFKASVQGTVFASIIGRPSISGTVNAIQSGVSATSVAGTVLVSSMISMPGIVSSANSTTATLAGGAAFTGTSEEVKDFGSIVISVFSDQASATDGLSIQQSSNGTNWDITDTYTVAASTGKTFQVQPAARFFRVVYTNGATPQTAFRLQTIYHPQMVKPTSQKAMDAYSNESDLEQQQAFNMVFNNSTWDRMRGNSVNGLLIYGSVQTVIAAVANQSVSGTVGASVIGTVPVTQAGAWTHSVVGTIFVAGSVATVGVAVANQSVSGTVNVGNFPISQNVSGSVVATQGTNPWIITGSVQASLSPVANQSVSGTVGASIIGTVPVTQGGTWIASVFGNMSVIGTVPVTQSGTVITSIVGAYAEDSAHTTGDIGVLTFGVRNDTVSSFTSANLDYGPIATDSAGRNLVKPFAAEESRIEGYNSVVSGSVTTIIAAAGAGLRNYITDVWVANTGASATLVTFRSQGGASVLGYTIAPAGGGSNLPGLQTPIRTGVNETFDIQATTATSILFATAKGYKAP